MPKEIAHGSDARRKIQTGVDMLANTVKKTLGPLGRNVILDVKYGPPVITKDGVTVARSIDFEDKYHNVGARLIKEVASKTNEVSGDGTTTATVLAQSIIKQGLDTIDPDGNSLLKRGWTRIAGLFGYGYDNIDPLSLKHGIEEGVKVVLKELQRSSKEVISKEQISQVASISSNSKEIGDEISNIIEKVGRKGIVTVEESNTLLGIGSEVVEGMAFDKGYISPYMITNIEKMHSELEEPYILITDKKISMMQELVPLIQKMTAENKNSLFIIADDLEGDALSTFITNIARGSFKMAATKAPGFGNTKNDYLEDIAILTGGKVISSAAGMKLEDVELSDLGVARRVNVTSDKTTIIGGSGDKEKIDARIAQVELLIKNSKPGLDNDNYKRRLSNLSGVVGVIMVGAPSEVEMMEKKHRIEDALEATKAAIEEGIVPGGGIALLRASSALEGYNFDNEDILGVEILKKALKEPFRQIIENAGQDPDWVNLEIGYGDTGSLGYDASKNEFVDMFEAGIIDPTKVVRTTIQNAASIGAIFLTTEAVVVDVPFDDVQIPMQQPMM